jgi:hypothetical protein
MVEHSGPRGRPVSGCLMRGRPCPQGLHATYTPLCRKLHGPRRPPISAPLNQWGLFLHNLFRFGDRLHPRSLAFTLIPSGAMSPLGRLPTARPFKTLFCLGGAPSEQHSLRVFCMISLAVGSQTKLDEEKERERQRERETPHPMAPTM